jgi:outer membrane protein assembly factor BamB
MTYHRIELPERSKRLVFNGLQGSVRETREKDMKQERRRFLTTMTAVLLCVLFWTGTVSAGSAKAIIDGSGVKGGLVVCLGAEDPEFLAGLRVDSGYLVHCLDVDPVVVAAARKSIQSRGLYGPVSVNVWNGKRLPYADKLVNLLIVTSSARNKAPSGEIDRVLVPLGICIQDNQKTVKPWPEELGEWGHFLHGADNNAVSADRVSGEPRHFQWMSGPDWARHHDVTPSISAFVSAKGRVFSIEDRAPIGFGNVAPDEWHIVARDGFNGLELWRVAIAHEDWGSNTWGGHVGGYGARYNHPHISPRLVAVGDKVFATPGMFAPVSAYDAATGTAVNTYTGTELAEEILVRGRKLIVSRKEKKPDYSKSRSSSVGGNVVLLLDVESGKQLWSAGPYEGLQFKKGRVDWRQIHISSNTSRVLCCDGPDIVALEMETGKEAWRRKRQLFIETGAEEENKSKNAKFILEGLPRIVATDDVILLAEQSDTPSPRGKFIGKTPKMLRLTAYSSEDGEQLWSYSGMHMAYWQPAEVFVVDGLVWVVDEKMQNLLGLDVKTGKEKQRRDVSNAYSNTHHHRCYVNRATRKYLATNRRGIEILPWDSDDTIHVHWMRGACQLGTFPCNGMLYALPNACDCYVASTLRGYSAIALKSSEPRRFSDGERLQKGPAYARRISARNAGDDWAVYRRDAGRSGAINVGVSGSLAKKWRIPVAPSGNLTAPICADGSIYVASGTTHKIYALNAEDGRIKWEKQLDSGVDSPPSFAEGYLLCGTRDGCVYCLEASSGELVWRFTAAPAEKLVMQKGVLESAWPVHGSVTVVGSEVFVTAGRSSYLDGGHYFYRLDVKTGKILEQKVLHDDFGAKTNGSRTYLAGDYGLLSDILVADGKKLFMRQRPIYGGPPEATQEKRGISRQQHFYALAGLLDSSWCNRVFWALDGIGFGQMMVDDEDFVYSARAYDVAGAADYFVPGNNEYVYSAIDRNNEQSLAKSKIGGRTRYPTDTVWSVKLPVQAKSMVLARETLLLVGVRDSIGKNRPDTYMNYRGEGGGVLYALSIADGRTLAKYDLESAPVYDGMAAVKDRLIVCCRDGSVECWEAKR